MPFTVLNAKLVYLVCNLRHSSHSIAFANHTTLVTYTLSAPNEPLCDARLLVRTASIKRIRFVCLFVCLFVSSPLSLEIKTTYFNFLFTLAFQMVRSLFGSKTLQNVDGTNIITTLETIMSTSTLFGVTTQQTSQWSFLDFVSGFTFLRLNILAHFIQYFITVGAHGMEMLLKV